MSSPTLRLTTFGGLALSRDGVPITGPAAQRTRLALLALIAGAGSAGITRDKLLLYLWPESTDERARHALKQAVYSLRRELGDEELIVGTASLSLNPLLITSDVREFEQAMAANDFASAAALYTGAFLDGIHLKDASEFEHWADEQRVRLAHLWASAVDKLAAESEAAGSWHDAVGYRRQLAASEPFNGPLAAGLMRALAESGDVAAALKHLRIYEALVREELNGTPDPEVVTLGESLTNGTWQRSAQPTPQSTPPAPAKVETSEPARRAPMSRRRARRKRLAVSLASALGLIMIASGSWFGFVTPGDRAALRTLMARGKPTLIPQTIIVAPLENKTNDAAMDVFGERAADWLGRELGDANFKVVDPRTARIGQEVVRHIPRPLRNGDIAVALAEETSAAYVLVGNYYKDGDSLEVNTSVIDVATRERVKSFGPFKGRLESPDDLLRRMIPPMLLYLRVAVDSSAGGSIASRTSPTSLEAFTRVSRAWERYFADPRDTGAVFAELDSAARLDTTYAAPLLFKAYILDVKAAWPQVEQIVRRVHPLDAKMTRLERAGLDLFDADLRGDAIDRVAIAHRIGELSPGSTEAPLLAVVSALYVGRVGHAVTTVQHTNPDRGMNLKMPAYWEWRAQAEHSAGMYFDEARSAQTGLHRFPRDSAMLYADVRVLAARNDRDLAHYLAKSAATRSNAEIDVALFAAQELRAHGHAARADSIASLLAGDVPVIVSDTSRRELDRFATVLYEAKRYDRARDLYARLVARDTADIDAIGRLAATAAHIGDTATAARLDRHLASLRHPFIHGRALRWRATLAAIGNRAPEAATSLEQAVREGYRLLDSPKQLTIHLDPDWTAVRASASFSAMMVSLQSP